MTLGEAARVLNASCALPDRALSFEGASIDSRNVCAGQLFFCLPGARADGHDFAGQAEQNGAAAIIARRALPDISIPVLVVPDCEQALGMLARYWRSRTKARVICITGTAGKTSLKNALLAILSEAGKVSATKGNNNNQIGLPLTILNGYSDDDYWLLEAGISHQGDMDYLGSIACPDLAIILNAGAGHTEGLGEKGVAWHKARLLKYLNKDGQALINSSYPRLVEECRKWTEKPHLFGKDNAEFHLCDICGDGEYVFSMNGVAQNFMTPFKSGFEWENALAAAAGASLAGVAEEAIRTGFGKVTLPSHRNLLASIGPFICIDASYNANPMSMRANIGDASSRAANAKKPLVLILGAMGELGHESRQRHQELGRLLARIRPAAIFWTGPWIEELRNGIDQEDPDAAMSPFIYEARSCDSFMRQWLIICDSLPQGAVLLFKGSRINRLEQYASAWLSHMNEIYGAGADVL